MSQVDEYTIAASPLLMTALATRLEDIFAAIASANRGATAPDNPFEGMSWWDTSGSPSEVLKRYTVAAGWLTIMTVNITTGVLTLPYALDSLTAAAAELNLLDGSVAGTAVASKALVLGANKNIDTLVVADGGLMLGSGAGTAVTATAAKINAAGENYPKAWVNFNGTGTVAIRSSYNVSSITDNGVGDYTINFTNGFADANYVPVGLTGATANRIIRLLYLYAGSLRIKTVYHMDTGAEAGDEDNVCVAIFR